MSTSSRPLKRAKKPARDSSNSCPSCWDDLPGDALLLIGCFVDALEVSRLALVNRATFHAIQQEIAMRSVLGIRLAYLNERGSSTCSNPPNRFSRLREIDYEPKTMEAFFQIEVMPPQQIVLQHMFAHNRSAGSNSPRFVLAGGSMLHYYQRYHEKDDETIAAMGRVRSLGGFGDLDVFVMESTSPESSDRTVESVLLKAGAEIERHDKAKSFSNTNCYDYGVYRHSGTFSMVVENKRPLQIILRRISCIEELLLFFDLDCCRFAFDGMRLVSTVEGLRSVATGQNHVDQEHVNNPMYCRRAIKYGHRGFNTGFGRIHPLQHMLPIHKTCFHNGEFDHSEKVERSTEYFVDEGLYSSLGNASLSELHEIAAWDSDRSDSEEEMDDEEVYKDEWGELRLKYRHNKRDLQSLLANDAGFAPSFEIHFDMIKSPMFQHFYYESHLRRKYNIARCYITRRWFHCAAKGEVHFSAEGRRINQVGYDVSRDLTGMVALVTGARIKIGFATCLELLRSGAIVIGTSRFVADAEARYRKEDDYEQFQDRLFLLPLNLLSVEDIQLVVEHAKTKFGKLHILINNAAQTVRLPLRCYTNLIQKEYAALAQALQDSNSLKQLGAATYDQSVNEGSKALAIAQTKLNMQIPDALAHLYAPPESLVPVFQSMHEDISERDRLRLNSLICLFKNPHPDDLKDFRGSKIPKNPMKAGRNATNSWKLVPTDVHPIELFEVQTINHLAPTMLLNALVPLLSTANAAPPASQHEEVDLENRGPSYVINVTSIEGQFSVADGVKDSHHLHTNMSKAALNMLTRCSSFYASKGILVNSVDTGWVSSTIPTWKQPPLTTHDAALRILYPILTKSTDSAKLYKNYQEVPW